ncbi:hypothetical protein C5F49_04585 [Nitrosopumilus oxyclinae]|uniref:Uncharacterized protein n=1 Tax=Nitrosopumilus oxyclinae TaxID=1959104 RepID=A0A7D5RE52_9ARCH|nr:hypothetical protein [Nitrosopumilus oxyclinae]QLH04665.1 hypothetical protein C5F49_04585 [Nitrosopumilus oxyclinae]
MSEFDIIIEKLLEQRNSYLNTLKHLDFELILDLSNDEIKNIEKLQTITIGEIKKIEQEIAFLTSKTDEKLQ